MEVPENGPMDKLLKKVMDKYWKDTGLKGEWHLSKSSALFFNRSKVGQIQEGKFKVNLIGLLNGYK